MHGVRTWPRFRPRAARRTSSPAPTSSTRSGTTRRCWPRCRAWRRPTRSSTWRPGCGVRSARFVLVALGESGHWFSDTSHARDMRSNVSSKQTARELPAQSSIAKIDAAHAADDGSRHAGNGRMWQSRWWSQCSHWHSGPWSGMLMSIDVCLQAAGRSCLRSCCPARGLRSSGCH